MTQTAIPFLLMRGGTSRGPYINRADLPVDLDKLAEVLMAAVGAGHPLNIDGVGGGNAVTTKVAMLSPSQKEDADIDYFFAQVAVNERQVDFKPTCGNILTGVAPAALEMGLIKPQGETTEVKIHAVNTGARIVAKVQTPNGQVQYDGNAAIDGVPNTAAPVELMFSGVAGSSTGALLPTKNLRDDIDGVEVTCMDVAMPMVIARAADFGLTGKESRDELNANREFFKKMEAVRIKAAEKMGMGDCRQSVTPKFGVLAKAENENECHIAARYFMPWDAHPTMAVTGGQCLAACALAPGSIADGLMARPAENAAPVVVTLHHPMGQMKVLVDYEMRGGEFLHKSAGLTGTARKLAAGHLFVPKAVWDGGGK